MSRELNDMERGDLVQAACDCLRRGSASLSNMPKIIRTIIKTEAWKRRETRGRIIECRNLRELITAKPLQGWGESADKVEAIIKDDAECLALFREAMVADHGGDRKSDAIKSNNVPLDSEPRGNAKAYTLSRLKSDSPELFQEVVAGKLSANAAAIKAGFRKPTVYVSDDPAKAADKILKVMGADFARAVLGALAAKLAEVALTESNVPD